MKDGLIKRMGLVKLFARVLSVDEAGQHWLRTPVEFGQIEVEDAPFVITALTSAGKREERDIKASDNLGRDYKMVQTRGSFSKTRTAKDPADSCPYLCLPAGLIARLSRPVWYELAGLAD